MSAPAWSHPEWPFQWRHCTLTDFFDKDILWQRFLGEGNNYFAVTGEGTRNCRVVVATSTVSPAGLRILTLALACSAIKEIPGEVNADSRERLDAMTRHLQV